MGQFSSWRLAKYTSKINSGKEVFYLKDSKLFELIDKSYNEDLSNQPAKYKETLLESAKMLHEGSDELSVCARIYKSYNENLWYL